MLMTKFHCVSKACFFCNIPKKHLKRSVQAFLWFLPSNIRKGIKAFQLLVSSLMDSAPSLSLGDRHPLYLSDKINKLAFLIKLIVCGGSDDSFFSYAAAGLDWREASNIYLAAPLYSSPFLSAFICHYCMLVTLSLL